MHPKQPWEVITRPEQDQSGSESGLCNESHVPPLKTFPDVGGWGGGGGAARALK